MCKRKREKSVIIKKRANVDGSCAIEYNGDILGECVHTKELI
jgi:hypothetical protein